MFPFMFFPFSILIPFLIFSVLFHLARYPTRHINRHVHRGIDRVAPRIRDDRIRRILGRKRAMGVDNDEFEVYMYRLAAKHHARLTSAQIVVESGLPMKEVDKRMASLVDNIHVIMEVSDDGVISYEFPGLRE